MALDSLLAKMECRAAATPDTPCNPVKVSAEPAPILACTRDTHETPLNGDTCNAEVLDPAAEARGADCMTCRHLLMRTEVHMGTQRIFWWRCELGHQLLEGRDFGSRTVLAPPECGEAGDFSQWQAGQQ